MAQGRDQAQGIVQGQGSPVRLGEALRLLLEVYDEWGGPSKEVGRVLRSRMDECLAEQNATRGRLQQRLAVLMRARDLHQYVVDEPSLVPLKLQLLELLLLHRSAEERWAAVRGLLLEHLEALCGQGRAGQTATQEAAKLALSDGTSILGKLLRVVAVFNLDQEGERPAAHLRLRFLAGRFPAHIWEAAGPAGTLRQPAVDPDWHPAHPLSRWTYLAADLGHAVYKRLQPRALASRAGEASVDHGAEAADAQQAQPVTLYCRLGSPGAGGDVQLELLPLDAREFLASLQRHVHRKQGPEALRLLALLLGHLDRVRPASACSFRLGDLLEQAGVTGLGESALKDRIRRLERLIESLADVELIRVMGTGGSATSLHSRFMIVMERRGEGLPRAGGTAAGGASALLKGVTLAADPWFFPRRGETLGSVFADLPAPLLAAPVKEHPFALNLFVHLRRVWRGGEDLHQATAAQLLSEAGLWLSESACYRALESLRRDVAWLRELGLVGAWRADAAASRDGRQAQYRIERPYPAGRRNSLPAPGPVARLTG